MEKQIEKAIKETLVISNPQSIHLAVKKILLLLDDSGEVCDHKQVVLVRHACKCKKCGKVMETEW
jgi:hypothetical protein